MSPENAAPVWVCRLGGMLAARNPRLYGPEVAHDAGKSRDGSQAGDRWNPLEQWCAS